MLSHARKCRVERLRVSAPIVGYHFLLPVIPDFLARYPEVNSTSIHRPHYRPDP